MSVEPTGDFTELVLHVLAHVPMGGAGCSYDPRYVRWMRGRAPDELERALHEDAEVLGRVWSGGRAPEIVHAWPELFGSIAALESCSTRELRELTPAQVRAPEVLARLVAEARPELELMHATLCMVAAWLEEWRAAHVEPALRVAKAEVERWLEPAAALLPSLATARRQQAWPLGSRGRGLPGRIVVGAPAAWHGLDARTTVVLAMHEQAVIDSGHARYEDAEWAALTGLAARMGEAPDPLRQAHAQWLASLELRPLLHALRVDDRITAERCSALEHDRRGRAAGLAALSR